jgi:hypothetical protein
VGQHSIALCSVNSTCWWAESEEEEEEEEEAEEEEEVENLWSLLDRDSARRVW